LHAPTTNESKVNFGFGGRWRPVRLHDVLDGAYSGIYGGNSGPDLSGILRLHPHLGLLVGNRYEKPAAVKGSE
jgi:hypothetical protein